MNRRGAVLIVVAGIASLIASLAFAFLVRMRADADEVRLLLHESQGRCMLDAALLYLQETARLGWDRPATPEHEEAFGWIDLRDGTRGPKDQRGVRLFTPGAWPDVGSATRCPMHLLERPPFALAMATVTNPIPRDPSRTWSDLISYARLDPRPIEPIVDEGTFAVDAASLSRFAAGRMAPIQRTLGRAWFRIHRDDDAVFTITCGAGPSAGFRDWGEVVAAGQEAMFGTREDFALIRAHEALCWFAAEWNPAVGGNTSRMNDYDYRYRHGYSNPHGEMQPGNTSRQFGGTFLWLQRLEGEPAAW